MFQVKKTMMNNQILKQLVSENCLRFGREPKLNNKQTNFYLFGTREKLDIFKLYEIRYLLLKVYPLIHNLFVQARLNVKKKKKFFFPRNLDFQKLAPKLPNPLREWAEFRLIKNKFNRSLMKTSKPLLPRILFATTNPTYSQIVSSAARRCYMPFHTNYWLCGSVTAGSFYKRNEEEWFFLQDEKDSHEDSRNDTQHQVQKLFEGKIFKQKKNLERQTQQARKNQISRKPSLLILPDVSNNEMILRETDVFGIPVIGLVNSHCKNLIAYPIFANDASAYSVYFFCHFLSALITKEMVKTKHKLQNRGKNTVSPQFPQAMKNMYSFYRVCARKWPLWSKVFRKKRKKKAPAWVFEGRYFFEQYISPRFRFMKAPYLRSTWNTFKRALEKKKNFMSFADDQRKELSFSRKRKAAAIFKRSSRRPSRVRYFPKNSPSQSFGTPTKMIPVYKKAKQSTYHFQKRLEKRVFNESSKLFRKKEMLQKIDAMNRLAELNLTRIQREIRLPEHLPSFRHWKSASFFYHSKSITLIGQTKLAYPYRKRILRKSLRYSFERRKHWARYRIWSLRKQGKYKKRWYPKRIWKQMVRRKKKIIEMRNKRNKRRFAKGRPKNLPPIQTPAFHRFLIKLGLNSPDPFPKKTFHKKIPVYRKKWPAKKIKKK